MRRLHRHNHMVRGFEVGNPPVSYAVWLSHAASQSLGVHWGVQTPLREQKHTKRVLHHWSTTKTPPSNSAARGGARRGRRQRWRRTGGAADGLNKTKKNPRVFSQHTTTNQNTGMKGKLKNAKQTSCKPYFEILGKNYYLCTIHKTYWIWNLDIKSF